MKRQHLVNNAKGLRREMTKAEELFWNYSRNRKVNGIKFRRQHPIGSFVLDFYWAEKKICVEIDGGIHFRRDVKENDESRTHVLNENGIRVIRFTNDEVMENIGAVMTRIIKFGEGV